MPKRQIEVLTYREAPLIPIRLIVWAVIIGLMIGFGTADYGWVRI